jgi:hypothetical protein
VGRRRDDGASELERWALRRAPELRARAEAEAVTLLRDALVAAALGDTEVARADAGPRHQTGSSRDDPRADTGPRPISDGGGSTAAPGRPATESGAGAPAPDRPDLLWAYCVLRAGDRTPADAVGISDRPVERIAIDGLAALVSRVPVSDFGAEPLRRNLNDLPWLERVARAHEAVLDAALAASTIVPLRMCTIFEAERGVQDMLERRREPLSEALQALDGRFEWAVKVLVDRDRLIEATRSQDSDAGEPMRPGEGGAYLQRRREERSAREAASRLAADIAAQVHARLQDWAIDARSRPPQNPELSGHEGEMVLNAAYLIERERTDELREIVAELEEHHRGVGARIELSGPWPPYNFVPGVDTAAMA